VTPQKHVIAHSGSVPDKIATSSWLWGKFNHNSSRLFNVTVFVVCPMIRFLYCTNGNQRIDPFMSLMNTTNLYRIPLKVHQVEREDSVPRNPKGTLFQKE